MSIEQLTKENAKLKAQVEMLRYAASTAKHFIINGVELGFIRMPDNDTPDPAHNTLPIIIAALEDEAEQCAELQEIMTELNNALSKAKAGK